METREGKPDRMTTPDTVIIRAAALVRACNRSPAGFPKELHPVSLTPLIHWALGEAADAGPWHEPSSSSIRLSPFWARWRGSPGDMVSR